jgi:hypothetical protein
MYEFVIDQVIRCLCHSTNEGRQIIYDLSDTSALDGFFPPTPALFLILMILFSCSQFAFLGLYLLRPDPFCIF